MARDTKPTKRVTSSLKGETVDFDLLEMKEQMIKAPKTEDTKVRERHVDRRRRRGSRSVRDVLVSQQINQASAEASIRRQEINKKFDEKRQLQETDAVIEDFDPDVITDVGEDEIKAEKAEPTPTPKTRTVRKRRGSKS